MRYSLMVNMILLWLITPAFSQGWEWLNPLPQGNPLTEVAYVGNGRLYGIAQGGASISSSDGGIHWQIANSGALVGPGIVDFVGTERGYGISDEYSPFGDAGDNRVFRTLDGGQSWDVIFHDPGINLHALSFVSEQVGSVMGGIDSTGRIALLNTVDGGDTWDVTLLDSTVSSPAKIFFLNELEGWISRYRSTALTTDGGLTWEWYSTPYAMSYDLVFIDSQHGWGANFNDIYYTSDGGRNWNPQHAPLIPTESVHSLAVIDANRIWAATSTDGANMIYNHLLLSTNGGATWERRTIASNANLQDIEFNGPQNGWVCGDDGLVFQTADGGTTWTRRCGDFITDGTVNFHAVSFANRQTGWIASGETYWSSAGGVIWHTMDGGVTWMPQVQDSNHNYYDIEAVSEDNIWAVGDNVIHTVDGGAHWDEVDIGGEYRIFQVISSDPAVIWLAAAAERLVVHRSIDGGATWESHDVELRFKFNGMAAAGPNHVWISGWADLDEGTVMHSSDGGITWETQGDTLGYLDGLFFVDSLHGWANSAYGMVRTVDGGQNWTVTGNMDGWIETIQFFDTLNGWASGYNTFRTTDGGLTWEHYETYRQSSSRRFDFVDPTYGWIVGGSTVMRFDGSILAAPVPPQSTPLHFTFLPAYPNPFNPSTTLRFELAAASRVQIDIFDVTGRLVQTVSHQVYTAGQHSVTFDGTDLASGIFFAQAKTASMQATQKLVLLK